jgi:DNA invertase Pin-like site-specific DNA recombinase
MKLAGYGRADNGDVPLNTQERAVTQYCVDNGHDLVTWQTDEIGGESSPFERDGFNEALRYILNEGADGVISYSWRQYSTDVVTTAALEPLFEIAYTEDAVIYTTDGELSFGESEDAREHVVGQAMAELTTMIPEWRRTLQGLKTKESIQALIERGEYKGGAPPYGLETDKQRYGRDKVYEYLPDDQDDEDKFKQAIEILNHFALKETTPHDREQDPTAKSVGREYGINSPVVETIWENQETYRDVAEEHRPEVTLYF